MYMYIFRSDKITIKTKTINVLHICDKLNYTQIKYG